MYSSQEYRQENWLLDSEFLQRKQNALLIIIFRIKNHSLIYWCNFCLDESLKDKFGTRRVNEDYYSHYQQSLTPESQSHSVPNFR